MITLDTLRDFLRIPIDDHDDDAVIELIEQNAVSMIETQTGITYPAAAASIVEYVRGNGTPDLFLAGNLTADPTEVLERAAVGDVGEAITAAQSDGWVRRGNRLLRKADAVWTLNYEYQISYAGGYAADAGPGDVRQAVMSIVAIIYRGRGTEGSSSESIGGYSVSRNDAEQIRLIMDSLPHRPVFA